MSELSNTATALGNYNSIPTSLTSNALVVNIIDGLSISKSADKTNWASGNLTYTITIDNQTDTAYENPVVTDIIDGTKVDFVDGSITINGTNATSSQYTFDSTTNTLTITLDEVANLSTTNITFEVKKKI